MRTKIVVSVVFAVLTLAVGSAAWADMAGFGGCGGGDPGVDPDPTAIDPCTLEQAELQGIECRACAQGGVDTSCVDGATEAGLTRSCERTSDDGAVVELWCRAAQASNAAASAGSLVPAAAVPVAFTGLATILLLARRRRSA